MKLNLNLQNLELLGCVLHCCRLAALTRSRLQRRLPCLTTAVCPCGLQLRCARCRCRRSSLDARARRSGKGQRVVVGRQRPRAGATTGARGSESYSLVSSMGWACGRQYGPSSALRAGAGEKEIATFFSRTAPLDFISESE